MPTGSGKSGDVETLGVTVEELERGKLLDRLNAITAEEPDPEDGSRTVREWAAYLKIGNAATSAKIKAALGAGVMERVTRRRRRSDGRMYDVECYRFVD